eukprot:jgi/Mesvir1/15857/Mv03403-RA.1
MTGSSNSADGDCGATIGSAASPCRSPMACVDAVMIRNSSSNTEISPQEQFLKPFGPGHYFAWRRGSVDSALPASSPDAWATSLLMTWNSASILDFRSELESLSPPSTPCHLHLERVVPRSIAKALPSQDEDGLGLSGVRWALPVSPPGSGPSRIGMREWWEVKSDMLRSVVASQVELIKVGSLDVADTSASAPVQPLPVAVALHGGRRPDRRHE